jgi:hypothetical protein
MRAALLALALVALLTAPALPAAHAIAPITVAISAPPGVGTGAAMTVMGRAETVQGQPVLRASVTILRDGVAVATVEGDNTGFYSATFPAPTSASDVHYRAHVDTPAGLFVGDSRDIPVMVRERSLPPQGFTAATDGVSKAVDMSWSAPADTKGAPLRGYQIFRQQGAGTHLIASVGADAQTFHDEDVYWGVPYRYHVRAVTFAGASAPSALVALTMPAAPSP